MSIVVVLIVVGAPARGEVRPEVQNGIKIDRSGHTGLASFVTAADGTAIPMQSVPALRRVQPKDFLKEHGGLFGVTDADKQLTVDAQRTRTDRFGYAHTTYKQVHKGIEVFAGVLKVHQDTFGAVVSANGDFFPIPDALNTTPTLTANQAIAAARSRIENAQAQPEVEVSRLVIVDPGWYGDVPAGAHLAYYIILRDLAAGVREAFFINAQTGKTLDQWNLLHTAKSRSVFDDSIFSTVRTEGGPPVGDFDSDTAYDYTGDFYDYLSRAFGRDSIDDFGASLEAVVHLQSTSCPNAFGGGTSSFFCTGVVTDDIVAHEFTHGLTEFTAQLIYQNQPGQLNESFSDVFGEIVDLLNGDAAFVDELTGPSWPAHGTGPGRDTPKPTAIPSILLTCS